MCKRVRLGLVWAIGVSSVGVAGAARAQDAELAPSADLEAEAPPRYGREAIQLSLQGSVFDYLKFHSKPEHDAALPVEAPEQDSSSTTYGLLGSGFGFGIGYAWNYVLLGARAQFTSTT